MAPIVPNEKKIKSFRTEAAFERWLATHHDRETEVWLRIFKKETGIPTVTPAQALDVALCWGWIDAIRKSFDERSFLQRYTPRGPRSRWSQINRDHVARLTAAGRMTPVSRPHLSRAGRSAHITKEILKWHRKIRGFSTKTSTWTPSTRARAGP